MTRAALAALLREALRELERWAGFDTGDATMTSDEFGRGCHLCGECSEFDESRYRAVSKDIQHAEGCLITRMRAALHEGRSS